MALLAGNRRRYLPPRPSERNGSGGGMSKNQSGQMEVCYSLLLRMIVCSSSTLALTVPTTSSSGTTYQNKSAVVGAGCWVLVRNTCQRLSVVLILPHPPLFPTSKVGPRDLDHNDLRDHGTQFRRRSSRRGCIS